MDNTTSDRSTTIHDCLIIGGGLSGLAAGRMLRAAGLTPLILDKGRGIGGRLATRWNDSPDGTRAFYDHGAQFFTVRTDEFRSLVDELLAAGIAREWGRGFADLNGIPRIDGHPRYVIKSGMNGLARYLASDLDIRTATQVTRIRQADSSWLVETASGESLSAHALILTPPAPQSLALLDAGHITLDPADRTALERLDYDPCFALLAQLDAPTRLPSPGALQIRDQNSSIIGWIADNHRKGISPDAFTITIHASPDFTRQNWDAPHEQIASQLLEAAAPWLNGPSTRWQVHRWRYSQPTVSHPSPCLRAAIDPPLLFAGDAFGQPRVEGAFSSGVAAARDLIAANPQLAPTR